MRIRVNNILTLVAAAGVVAVVFCVRKDTLKAEKELEELYLTGQINGGLSTTQELKKTIRCYIPTIAVTGITLAALIGSDVVAGKAIGTLEAAVASGAALACRPLLKTRNDEDTIAYKAQQNPKKIFVPVSAEETGYGDTLCYEAYTGRWFRSSHEAVEDAIDKYKKDLHGFGSGSFNDLYEYLGVTESQFGNYYGFIVGEDWYEDVEFKVTDLPAGILATEPVVCIDVMTWPIEDWYEYA